MNVFLLVLDVVELSVLFVPYLVMTHMNLLQCVLNAVKMQSISTEFWLWISAV